MSYFHDLVTEKSWLLLQNLKKEFEFILIGDWAVWLWTHALKSKDIDLVVEYGALERIREKFDVNKNERLKKYEARRGEVEMDLYVPFYSNPGIPAEEIKKFVARLEGFATVKKEVLALLKLQALRERANSVKGRKDLIDLVTLFSVDDFHWEEYRMLLSSYGLEEHSAFTKALLKTTGDLEEIDLNSHKMARLKKRLLPLI